MSDETHVISWSNKLLDYLLEYRQQHPSFKFWLRQRDRGDRLSNGYWFQGNDNYIFLSFWARSGGTNMTRSLGWVLGIDEDGSTRTSMEVAYNGEKDQEIIAMYNTIIKRFHMEPVTDTKYKTRFNETDPFKSLAHYLKEIKPAIDDIIRNAGKEEMFIEEQDFNDMLNKTLSLRQAGPKSLQRSALAIIMVNITWNSNDWQNPSDDKSNHGWVKEGNTPFESWNFDFDNERNPADKIYGYCQFVAAPLVEGTNNIIIFYSQGKIVGFYGKAEVLREPVVLPNELRYNLIGEKTLSLVLTNKLDNIKESGYLEDKQRMGQNGFIYLSKPETVLDMLQEAAALNPEQNEKLTNLKNWIEGFVEPVQTKDNTQSMDTALNQIFFGPPGTGKTYHTVSEAIKIVDPEFYKLNQSKRTKLKERFRELLIKDWKGTQGQIAFCTFHQSFSYEDFVEGIKPISPVDGDTYLKYKVEDGIFKRICRLSEDHQKTQHLKTERLISWNEDTFKKAVFYKVSLGNSNKDDDQAIYEYCIKNNCIALGYGGENDFTGLDEEQIIKKCKELGNESFTEQAVNRFIHYLKVGNYVLVSNGNRYVRAIGRVTGPYKYDPNTSIRYRHFRPVEWLLVDQDIPITELYDRSLSQQTLYKLDEDGIKKEFFVNTGQLVKAEPKQHKNFVLIIDEINRGNVSSIFGELITLIERDKRASSNPESEELEVTLPYSKEPFKVPENVYIIGTMNTADRSIEALDTALRRRFSFREMQSKPELLVTESTSKGKIGSIDLVQLLNTINQRIEKLIDKDHKIGHAYFMEDTTEEALKNTFHNKVIPLLQEYFFGDFGKIGLVLGNSFVEKVSDGFEFAKFESYDSSVSTDLKERPVYKIADKAKWNFQSIYE